MSARRQRSRKVAPLFVALGLALLLGGCAAFGTVLASGKLPIFYKPIWFGPHHALVISNGGICPPGYAANPCHRPTFRVNIWLPGASWTVISWPQR